jgi:hypothetical protein
MSLLFDRLAFDLRLSFAGKFRGQSREKCFGLDGFGFGGNVEPFSAKRGALCCFAL